MLGAYCFINTNSSWIFLLLACCADLSTGDQVITRKSIRTHLNLHLNCLLATRQNDSHQDQDHGDLSPALTREVILATPSSAPSVAEEISESGSAFQTLIVFGKATLINISISNGDLICQRIIKVYESIYKPQNLTMCVTLPFFFLLLNKN